MTEKCLEIGAIQAFSDGELDFEQSEAVAHHVAVCDDCAVMLAAAEEESSFAFSALELEFNSLVPTQRLWTKINDSIEREKQFFWTPIFAFFKQPSIAAFAGLLIVAGLFALVLNRGNGEESKVAALNDSIEKSVGVPVSKQIEASSPTLPTLISNGNSKKLSASEFKKNRADVQVVQAKLIKENRLPNVKFERREIKKDVSGQPASENLAGEESYIKTIATLTETVKNRKDEMLKPSARFAFERDLAVAENAIKTMKAEIKQNPKAAAAKQILRASYQNKIDLLNSVADKTEFMASLK